MPLASRGVVVRGIRDYCAWRRARLHPHRAFKRRHLHALSIPAYRYGGFAALGLAYVLWYGAYCAITCAVCLRRYGMRLRGSSLRLLLGTVGVAIACLLLCELIGNWLTLAITLPPSSWLAYKNILRR